MTVEKTPVERRSNDGTTRLADRCDHVENAHASYHVDARVHVRPVFSGSVIICWRCPSQSNGTIQDYCVLVTAIRQSLKKAQEQAHNSKPLLHSACSEASICKINPMQAMVVTAYSFPAPYSTWLQDVSSLVVSARAAKV